MKETICLASQVPQELADKLEKIAQYRQVSLEQVIADLLEKILAHKGQRLPEAAKPPLDSKNDNS